MQVLEIKYEGSAGGIRVNMEEFFLYASQSKVRHLIRVIKEKAPTASDALIFEVQMFLEKRIRETISFNQADLKKYDRFKKILEWVSKYQ